MNFNDYQSMARDFAIYKPAHAVIYPALGLAGEAGEVAEKVKKHLRDGKALDVSGVAKELGDVLWYIANLASDMGVTLQEIADLNIDKLLSRQDRGVLKGSGDDR